MQSLSQYIEHEHEEINDPIDEVTREVSAACDLVDELLESVKAHANPPVFEADSLKSYAGGLIELAAILGDVSSGVGSCKNSDLQNDPLDLIGTIDPLVVDVESLIATGRRLAVEIATTDEEMARELHEVVGNLAGTIASIIRGVNCYRPI